MFQIDMSMDQNFASFHDQSSDNYVFVDSFDNVEFTVTYGSVADQKVLGVIYADSDAVLNDKLRELVRKKINTISNDH
jgi:hypothetical protein